MLSVLVKYLFYNLLAWGRMCDFMVSCPDQLLLYYLGVFAHKRANNFFENLWNIFNGVSAWNYFSVLAPATLGGERLHHWMESFLHFTVNFGRNCQRKKQKHIYMKLPH